MSNPEPPPVAETDPLYLHARRELRFTIITWTCFAVWVIGVSWWQGRPPLETDIPTMLGMPAWVFWGVGVPWLAANGVTFWFCFRFMSDDPLDEVPGEGGDESSDDAGVGA